LVLVEQLDHLQKTNLEAKEQILASLLSQLLAVVEVVVMPLEELLAAQAVVVKNPTALAELVQQDKDWLAVLDQKLMTEVVAAAEQAKLVKIITPRLDLMEETDLQIL
jgi:hypothetical protein